MHFLLIIIHFPASYDVQTPLRLAEALAMEVVIVVIG